ncbi:MAG: PEP-CTERM sorting domain-containing protein [Betaproteobacteria bacterium]|nr:MAG: PEP-CTERM sorting domain-containing protein [Betaproteobacteria bacterium]
MAVIVSSVIAGPAGAQSWSGALPAVQSAPGSPSRTILTFELPGVPDIMGWDLHIAYSSQVFEPLEAGAYSSPYPFVFDMNTVGSGVPDTNVFRGLTPEQIDLLDSRDAQGAYVNAQAGVGMLDLGTGPAWAPLNHPGGALFQVQFQTKLDAVLGPTSVLTHFNYYTDAGAEIALSEPLVLSTSIAAIPEPQTWAMLLAGLALVGGYAGRPRRRALVRAG